LQPPAIRGTQMTVTSQKRLSQIDRTTTGR